MTGLYVRIRRDDGSIDNVEIDRMTDAEMRRFVESQPPTAGWRWAVVLAKWIREHVCVEEKEAFDKRFDTD